MTRSPRAIAALAITAGVLISTPARAHGPGEDIVTSGALIAEGLIGAPMAIGGIITIMHNAGWASRGQRVSPGWRNTGYVFGTLNLVVSAAWVGFALGAGTEDSVGIGSGLAAGMPSSAAPASA